MKLKKENWGAEANYRKIQDDNSSFENMNISDNIVSV